MSNRVNRRRIVWIAAVSQYQEGSDVEDLPGVRADAESLRRTLEECAEGGVYSSTFLRDEECTRENLLHSLDHLEASATDQVIVYFAGHGCRSRSGEGCLLPWDSSRRLAEEKGLSTKAFGSALSGIKAGELVVILDCCGLSLSVFDLSPEFQRELSEDRRSVFLMSASREFEEAFELDSGGFFTESLCNALKGQGLRETTEVISAMLAFDLATQELRKKTAIHGHEQEAICSGHGGSIYLTHPIYRNPFKGLSSFRKEEADDFFGRKDEAGDLAERVQDRSLTFVLGQSGSGKSSLVQAGLMARLARSEGWRMAIFRPGLHPYRTLGEALLALLRDEDITAGIDEVTSRIESDPFGLRSTVIDRLKPGVRTLLIVDQFEELFSSRLDEQGRDAYIDCLLNAAYDEGEWPIHVVLVVRSDFYEELEQTELEGRFQDNVYHMRKVAAHHIPEIVRGPLERTRQRAEPELIEELVRDYNRSHNLAILQHALSELWKLRDGNTLTWAAYRHIEGLGGALNTHAESVFTRLDEAQKRWTEVSAARLVRFREREPVRVRVELDVLLSLADTGDRPRARDALALLVDERLLTASRGPGNQAVVEIAHEIIPVHWNRMAGWLDRFRAYLSWYGDFEPFFNLWKRDDRAWWRRIWQWRLKRELLKGGGTWLRRKPWLLVPEERSFIGHSLRAAQIMAVLRVVLTSGLLMAVLWGAWTIRTRTHSYQLQEIVAEAPALLASVKRLEIGLDWVSQLVLHQGPEAVESVDLESLPGSKASVLAELALLLSSSPRPETAESFVERARVAVEGIETADERFRIHLRLAEANFNLDRSVEAETALKQAQAELEGIGADPEWTADLLQVEFKLGHLDRGGLKVAASGIDISAFRDEVFVQTAVWEAEKGRLLEAFDMVSDSVANPGAALQFLRNIADRIELADLGPSGYLSVEDVIRRTLDVARTVDARFLAMTQTVAASTWAELGNLDAALQIGEQIANPYHRALALAAIGTAAASDADLAGRASEILGQAEQAAFSIPTQGSRSEALAAVAGGLARAGELRRARLLAQEECLEADRLKAYARILNVFNREGLP